MEAGADGVELCIGVVEVGARVLCCGRAERGGVCGLRGLVRGEGGGLGRGCLLGRSAAVVDGVLRLRGEEELVSCVGVDGRRWARGGRWSRGSDRSLGWVCGGEVVMLVRDAVRGEMGRLKDGREAGVELESGEVGVVKVSRAAGIELEWGEVGALKAG